MVNKYVYIWDFFWRVVQLDAGWLWLLVVVHSAVCDADDVNVDYVCHHNRSSSLSPSHQPQYPAATLDSETGIQPGRSSAVYASTGDEQLQARSSVGGSRPDDVTDTGSAGRQHW